MMKIFVAISLLFITSSSYSMSYEYVEFYKDSNLPKKIRMSGEIVSGDYQKLISFLKDNEPQNSYFGLGNIELDSNGGNIKEAMKIARLINKAYPNIEVKNTCASSCVLIWLSGARRHLEDKGRLGIHRPTFPKKYYETSSLEETKRNYETLSNEFKNFLLEQGLPISLYEKLLATNSIDMLWLQKKDIDLIGQSSPYFDEMQHKLCGEPLRKYIETNKDEDQHALSDCLLGITKPARIRFFDEIYGVKNTDWSRVKKLLLEMD